MKELTKKQQETISKNLRAFCHNYGPIKIIRQDYGPGFYVYSPADIARGIIASLFIVPISIQNRILTLPEISISVVQRNFP